MCSHLIESLFRQFFLQVFEWTCTEDGGDRLMDVASPPSQRLLQFAKSVPGELGLISYISFLSFLVSALI